VTTPRTPPKHKSPSLVQSFNYAFEGIVRVLRRERNMRIHFAAATAALVLAIVYDVTRLELIAIVFAISFVFIAEMVNTAVEAAVDVATTAFHPLAKLAKDISAGAVLIASVNAVVVGYLVFADRLAQPSYRLITQVRDAPVNATIGALVVTVILVIAFKAWSGRGTPLRGGLPSGHAALAFAGWVAITFVTADFRHRLLVSLIAFILAALVAQTRVESGIHSVLEVAAGAALGSVVTLLVFQAVA
jgi:diacylglycerol kinase (ATP)